MQARNDYVIAKRLDGEKATPSGLVLPNPEKQYIAEVLSIGPRVESVKVGDRILICDHVGREILHEGEKYEAWHDDDLIAIVE